MTSRGRYGGSRNLTRIRVLQQLEEDVNLVYRTLKKAFPLGSPQWEALVRLKSFNFNEKWHTTKAKGKSYDYHYLRIQYLHKDKVYLRIENDAEFVETIATLKVLRSIIPDLLNAIDIAHNYEKPLSLLRFLRPERPLLQEQ